MDRSRFDSTDGDADDVGVVEQERWCGEAYGVVRLTLLRSKWTRKNWTLRS